MPPNWTNPQGLNINTNVDETNVDQTPAAQNIPNATIAPATAQNIPNAPASAVPQATDLAYSQGQSLTGTINAQGVTPAGASQAISWDDFNGIAPAQQKQILKSMGLNDTQINGLLGALQKTEISQYQQFKTDQAHANRWNAVDPQLRWVHKVPLVGGLLDQLAQTEADVTGGALGMKGFQRTQDKSLADLQKAGGLTDVIKQLNVQNAIQQATGQGQPSQVLPAGSTAQLNAYTQNYLLPAMKASNDIMNQDAMQWGAFTQQFQKQHPSDPIAQILSQQYAAQAPLYDRLLGENWSQVLSPAYVGQMNKALGAQAATGARSLTEYGTQSTVNALAQGAGVGGMGAATPSQIAGGTVPNSLTALFPNPASALAAAQYNPNVAPSQMPG